MRKHSFTTSYRSTIYRTHRCNANACKYTSFFLCAQICPIFSWRDSIRDWCFWKRNGSITGLQNRAAGCNRSSQFRSRKGHTSWIWSKADIMVCPALHLSASAGAISTLRSPPVRRGGREVPASSRATGGSSRPRQGRLVQSSGGRVVVRRVDWGLRMGQGPSFLDWTGCRGCRFRSEETKLCVSWWRCNSFYCLFVHFVFGCRNWWRLAGVSEFILPTFIL